LLESTCCGRGPSALQPKPRRSPRHLWQFFLFTLALLPLTALSAAPFVYESEREFYTTGDFDGDGREDFVIVDKASGDYRLGYQLTAGNHTWVKPRASGVENVTGFSVGHLLATNRDALAFTAPDANRVNILDASSATVAGLPVSAFPSSIGPNLVVAMDVGGAGNTPLLDDLLVATSFNGAPLPSQLGLMRNDGAPFTSLPGALSSAQLFTRGNRVVLQSGRAPMAGLIISNATDTFVAYDLTGGALVQAAAVSGLPGGSASVFANFDGSTNSQFLFYAPGQSNLLLRPVQEVAGTLQFGAGASFHLGLAISQVLTLPGAANTKLLILFGQGERARVYNFNGSAAPALVQEFTAQSGELFTGAGVSGGNNFVLYSGRNGSRTSTFFQAYNFNGSSYTPGASGSLPSLHPLTAPANVFLFAQEPFVAPSLNLLRSLNAGDWSAQMLTPLPTPGEVSVASESFLGGSQGLRNRTTTLIGAAPALAMFGLVNQYREQISLFNYGPANGDEIADVTISPAPGLYKKGVQIKFTAGNPAHQIFYRLNPSAPWTPYANPLPTPFFLFKNTTVSYYAKPVGGDAKSRIKNAAYSFTLSPGQLDSDGDGVPDFVESANGLDPLRSGTDSDGDGYPDLDELLAGTNPTAKGSPPTNVVERKAVFDLALTPRPLDGFTSIQTVSAVGTLVRAFDLQGSLLAFAQATNRFLSGVLDPVALAGNVVLDTTDRLVVAATEPHFFIAPRGSNEPLGRELVGVFQVPPLSPPLPVADTYTGGDLTSEANKWLTAARATNAASTRPLVVSQFGIYDTLSALLLEQKLGQILVARGTNWGTNLTLFPFRPTDAGRTNVSQSALLALESRTASQPAFLLRQAYRTITNAVALATLPGVVNLRKLTAEIYRLSSASNNIPTGATNYPIFPLPVDVLRGFLNSGLLQSNYATRVALSSAELTAPTGALAGATAVLSSVAARPTTNLTLFVRTDSFTESCTTLETTLGLALKSLFHAEGTPFRFPETFDLVAGSQVEVTGYTDIPGAPCAGGGIEVITLKIQTVPAPSNTDSNGNLLPDGWECAFNLTDPFGDGDRDGVSNLQEMFDGTDPRDVASRLASALLSAPPAIDLSITPGGSVLLSWSWPAAYAGRVSFGVRSTDDLGTAFTEVPIAASDLGGGHFQATLPNPGTTKRFYVLYLALR